MTMQLKWAKHAVVQERAMDTMLDMTFNFTRINIINTVIDETGSEKPRVSNQLFNIHYYNPVLITKKPPG